MRRLVAAASLTAWLAVPLFVTSCGDDETTAPSSIIDISIQNVQPVEFVRGTTIDIDGSSFIPEFAGKSFLILAGTIDGDATEMRLPLNFQDYSHMTATWLGGPSHGLTKTTGVFEGVARVEVANKLDGRPHRSADFPLSFFFADVLELSLESIENSVIFVNDQILVHGGTFFLDGNEGRTVAVVTGCFQEDTTDICVPVGPVDVTARPAAPHDRHRAVFPFAPSIAGIKPGQFMGSVQLRNDHNPNVTNGEVTFSDPIMTQNVIIAPTVTAIGPTDASLGQYVDIRGGGFVGGEGPQAVTRIRLDGTFTVAGSPAITTSIDIIPEFVSGQLNRYVVNEDDALSALINVRTDKVAFDGTLQPITQYNTDTVNGTSTNATFSLAPVRQVVELRFLPSFVESLTFFGLRAADADIRRRVVEVVERDFGGVNIEFRQTPVEDFKLFSVVEVNGPDPNGLGYFGYDNTPGKDVGNVRLYDRIGGVNAITQQDGFAGFGGVFVESLFAFSQHPGAFAESFPDNDGLFDQVFDPFRPDQAGSPVSGADLSGALFITDQSQCPAADRATQVGCAIFVLGNLIGTTLTHEVAHSLGLADPGGNGVHNRIDVVSGIMDGGGARSFRERSELGEGPGVFCDDNYAYLKQVLPNAAPDPLPSRPSCQ